MSGIKARLDKIGDHLKTGYDGGIRIAVVDMDYANKNPEAFQSFIRQVIAACPGIDAGKSELLPYGRLYIEDVRPGWAKHWPNPSGDEVAVDSIVKQDVLEAFLDWTDTLDTTEYQPSLVGTSTGGNSGDSAA